MEVFDYASIPHEILWGRGCFEANELKNAIISDSKPTNNSNQFPDSAKDEEGISVKNGLWDDRKEESNSRRSSASASTFGNYQTPDEKGGTHRPLSPLSLTSKTQRTINRSFGRSKKAKINVVSPPILKDELGEICRNEWDQLLNFRFRFEDDTTNWRAVPDLAVASSLKEWSKFVIGTQQTDSSVIDSLNPLFFYGEKRLDDIPLDILLKIVMYLDLETWERLFTTSWKLYKLSTSFQARKFFFLQSQENLAKEMKLDLSLYDECELYHLPTYGIRDIQEVTSKKTTALGQLTTSTAEDETSMSRFKISNDLERIDESGNREKKINIVIHEDDVDADRGAVGDKNSSETKIYKLSAGDTANAANPTSKGMLGTESKVITRSLSGKISSPSVAKKPGIRRSPSGPVSSSELLVNPSKKPPAADDNHVKNSPSSIEAEKRNSYDSSTMKNPRPKFDLSVPFAAKLHSLSFNKKYGTIQVPLTSKGVGQRRNSSTGPEGVAKATGSATYRERGSEGRISRSTIDPKISESSMGGGRSPSLEFSQTSISLNRILELMTTDVPGSSGTEIINKAMFVTLYPVVTSTAVVLLKLIQRYFFEPLVSQTQLETFRKYMQPLIQFKVVSILKDLIRSHWKSMSTKERSLMRCFIHVLDSNTVKPLAFTIGQMNKQKRDENMILSPHIPLLKTLADKNFDILDFPPMDVAKVLCVYDYKVYSKIEVSELCRQCWTKRPHLAPNVRKLIDRFNTVTQWIASSIVTKVKISQRVKRYKFVCFQLNIFLCGIAFIKVAEHLLFFNNFHSMMAVISGLNENAVYRLIHTRDEVGPKFKEVFESLQSVMSSDNSYGTFRSKINNAKPPGVPYIGVYLRDLTYLDDGIKTPGGYINLKQMKVMFKIINTLSKFQKTPYTFELDDKLTNVMENLEHFTSKEDLLELSKKREPKKCLRVDII